MNDNKIMNRAANNIRVLAASMVEKAKSGHPGGAMGGADFINVLFSEFLVYDPDDARWTGRDRFFLDPGHMSPMLYAALTLRGMFTMDDIKQFRQWGSPCPGHPELDVEHGVENSSGPLGQGHAIAAGAAVAEKFMEARLGANMMQHTIYCYISDGAVEEEISQGVGRLAGTLGLNNLIMFYDSNAVQLSTNTDEVMAEDTAAKYKAWNWNVIEINGNDVDQIRGALKESKMEKNRPTLIIGHTIMAKGALKDDGSSYEGSVKTHGAPLGGEAYRKTIMNLGGNPDDPFVIWDDVRQLYENRRKELKNIVAERRAAEQEWRKAHSELSAQMDDWFAGKAPKVDFSQLLQKRDVATRAASAACLGELAKQVPNMICGSADLSNSDKTDGFLKQTSNLTKGDFSGAFFQAGVAELTMADMCIGMALHGCIAACGTFFVFSDYMKPAVRMAALM
ncbi:MAG: transketolase, partial [Prevotella sp.]